MKANFEASNVNGRWECVKPVRQQAVSVSSFSTMNWIACLPAHSRPLLSLWAKELDTSRLKQSKNIVYYLNIYFKSQEFIFVSWPQLIYGIWWGLLFPKSGTCFWNLNNIRISVNVFLRCQFALENIQNIPVCNLKPLYKWVSIEQFYRRPQNIFQKRVDLLSRICFFNILYPSLSLGIIFH